MKGKLFVFAATLFFAQIVYGVSIAPEILESLRQSGQLQDIVAADKMARDKGVWEPNPQPFRFGITADVDTLHCLIILVDFDDMPHEWNFHAEPANFDTLLFSFGLRHPGSMTDYYAETSYGHAYLVGQVTSWYRMPQLYSYYVDGQRGFGEYPHNAQRLAEDAVVAADPDVDFSLYDNNGDSWVDALFVVHAGPGYEDTGNLNYIHSHAWSMSEPIFSDGVNVFGYSMEPEETASRNLITIGVFCHEFGHVLGLPDLYDYDYDSQGVGDWSVMAGGSWGGGGAVPVHFDGWCKFQLGWAIPTVVSESLPQEEIDAVEFSPDVYQLFSLGMPDHEYFIVENRRQQLFDVSLPGDGLLIYHVDELAPNNNDQTHYKVAVEQADGQFDLEHNIGANAGDPWPGYSDNRTFDDFSLPNSNLYGRFQSEVAVANISNSDSIMFADLSVTFSEPLYQLQALSFNDSSGNSNGRPDAGETCRLDFTAVDVRAYVNMLTVIGSCSDPSIIFSDSVSYFVDLPTNDPFNNSLDPMTFSVPPVYEGRFVYFTLTFVALNGAYRQEITRRILVSNPEILLVDDDNSAERDTFYTQILDTHWAYEVWNVATQGSPALVLSQHPKVIWFTGDSRPDAMPAEDVSGLISYLSGGGRLMITSQDFVQRLSERGSSQDSVLLHQYLKTGYNMFETDHHPTGVAGTAFDSLVFLTSGSGGANNQLSEDALFVDAGGTEQMRYRSNRTAAVGVVNTYIALTVGFGMEGINDLFPALYDFRSDFMQAALNYLSQPVSVSGSEQLQPDRVVLDQNYPNPFNPTTEIAFELPSAGNVQLVIYDLLGRAVDRPVDGFMPAGRHIVMWDGASRPSGVYFYRINTGNQQITKRMLLLK